MSQENAQPSPAPVVSHRFLDEAGDTTFFGKGKVVIIGQRGVSLSFSLGMVKFNTESPPIRKTVMELQKSVESDDYLNRVCSVAKKIADGGFYFHATDDPPEVRERFIKFIKTLDCSAEIVVARKIPAMFAKRHNNRESEFYADLLSHLLKNKLKLGQKIVLNIAGRGESTRNSNLQLALKKATDRFLKTRDESEIASQVVFNVQNHTTEPLLNVADYFCWAVQRVFERGDTRYYDYLQDKISLVVDLYDSDNYKGSKNYYKKGNPLTAGNKLSPPSP